jgi:hypothetical protein
MNCTKMAQNWGEYHFIFPFCFSLGPENILGHIRPGASSLVAFRLSHPAALASFPSAGCFGFCLSWSNRGHLVCLSLASCCGFEFAFWVPFWPSRPREALMRLSSKKGGGRYFRISVCLFHFAFVLCRLNRISKVELPLDWLRALHEPLLSFKPAINFIAPWFGLAPKPSQYFLVLDWAAKIFAV